MKIFEEKQRSTQTSIIVILIVSSIPPLIIITNEYFEKKITLENYIFTLAIIIVATCLIFLFKLKTRIDKYGINYQFFPFHLKFKHIDWKEITSVNIINYDPISEYGGWGIKGSMPWAKKKKRAYTMSGYEGIEIKLKNGNSILIGTLKKEKVALVLKNYKIKLD